MPEIDWDYRVATEAIEPIATVHNGHTAQTKPCKYLMTATSEGTTMRQATKSTRSQGKQEVRAEPGERKGSSKGHEERWLDWSIQALRSHPASTYPPGSHGNFFS